MKSLVKVLLASTLPLVACGAEFRHLAATVNVPGAWDKDKESNADTLILNSRPQGRQIVVSQLVLKKKPTNLDEIVAAAQKVFEIRLANAQKLSGGGARFENPDVTNTNSSVVCICRGYDARNNVRMAFRIEGSAETVRSTSVYDYTGPSAEEFQKWSAAMFAGVK